MQPVNNLDHDASEAARQDSEGFGARTGTAVVTGASRGLGLALAEALAADGWNLVIDARDAKALDAAANRLATRTTVRAIRGDIQDADHRRALVFAARMLGGPDVLVLNAGTLGPSPLPALANYPIGELERVYKINVLAQLALVQEALPLLRPGARIIAVTSDAAREAYPGWGGYGSSKAALEQLASVLAAEQPELLVYSADPGDMRTRMHADAFPGEDISDRPLPEVSVPGLLRLVYGELPSGRYEVRSLDSARSPDAVPADAVPAVSR
jgi:NAD(P)-dependent dehydrogenase (short-subunit alcohol dehydrogenase family)